MVNKKLDILNQPFLYNGVSKTEYSPDISQFLTAADKLGSRVDSQTLHTTLESIIKFLNFVKFKPYEVVFLETREIVEDLIKIATYKSQQNFMIKRWIPGMLTNWKQVEKELEGYKKLVLFYERVKREGITTIEGTTKIKHRLLNAYYKQYPLWKGLEYLEDRPKLLIVTHAEDHLGVLREAQRAGVPTIALCNTKVSPTTITYPLVCNTDSIETTLLFLEMFTELLIQNYSDNVVMNKLEGV